MKIKLILLIFCIYSLLFSQQSTYNSISFNKCLNSVNDTIEKNELINLIQPFLPLNTDDGTIYLVTSDGKLERIVNLFSNPIEESVCDKLSNFNEIGINRDKQFVLANKEGEVVKVNRLNCEIIENQTINVGKTIHALAVDKKNSIYIDNYRSRSHTIFRSVFDNITKKNTSFNPFITLDHGQPNGDILVIDKSIFASWKMPNGTFYLYEFILDDNFEYTNKYYNWGKITFDEKDIDFFGLAFEFNRLFGITYNNKLYEVVLDFKTKTFQLQYLLKRNKNNVKWIGAAGLNEASEYKYTFYYDKNLKLEIDDFVYSTIKNLSLDNKIYVKIEDINNRNFSIVELILDIGFKPEAYNLTKELCATNKLNLQLFNKDISKLEYKYLYYSTLEDLLEDKNEIVYEIPFTESKTFYVKVINSKDCFSIAEISLKISNNNIKLIEDIYLCNTPKIILAPEGYLTYQWEKENQIISTNNYIELSKEGNYKLIVETREGCKIVSNFTVYKDENFKIDDVIISNNTVSIYTKAKDILYSIDNINYQTSPIFSNLPEKEYVFYIKNREGCIASYTFKIANEFNFISPNSDGYNDKFDLENYRKNYPNSIIGIYDRYGKALLEGKTINVLPWNGKINNIILPSDTYWYKITDNNQQIKQGYIVLKNK